MVSTLDIINFAVSLCHERLTPCCRWCKCCDLLGSHVVGSSSGFYCSRCLDFLKLNPSEQVNTIDTSNIKRYLASFIDLDPGFLTDEIEWSKNALNTIKSMSNNGNESILEPLYAVCLSLQGRHKEALNIASDIKLREIIVTKFWDKLSVHYELIRGEMAQWRTSKESLIEITNQLYNFNNVIQHLLTFKKPLDSTFKITLVGGSSVGKSTVINSILGGLVLHSDVLPSTSGVIICENGNKVEYYRLSQQLERVTELDEQSFSSDANFDSDFSEDLNDEFEQKIFSIQLPGYELLQLDINLCDTAGINQKNCEAIDSNTLEFVENSDVVICVVDFTNIQYPDRNILSILKEKNIEPNIILYNMVDKEQDKSNVERYKKYHQTQVIEYFGDIPSFRISAKNALESKMKRNQIPDCEFFEFQEHLLLLVLQKLQDFPQYYSTRILEVLNNIITTIIEEKSIEDINISKNKLFQQIEKFMVVNSEKFKKKIANSHIISSDIKDKLYFEDILDVGEYNERVVSRVVNCLLLRLVNIQSIQLLFLTKLGDFLHYDFANPKNELPNPVDQKNDIIERSKLTNFGFWESTISSKIRNIGGFFSLLFQLKQPHFGNGERKKKVGKDDIDHQIDSVVRLFPDIMLSKMKTLAESIIDREYQERMVAFNILKASGATDIGNNEIPFNISDLDELMKNYVETYFFANKVFYKDKLPELTNPIGSGAYGTVYRIFWNNQNKVVKVIPRAKQDYPFYREVFILIFLNIKYKLKELAQVETILRDENNTIYIIQDELDQNLAEWNQTNPSRFQKIKILIQIADALKKVHAFNIVHRDISAKNIMISSNVVTLVDFGFGKICLGEDNSSGGTTFFRSPQVAEGGLYTYKCDIYSFGKLLEYCGIDQEFSNLCHRCTAREEEHRPDNWDIIIQEMKSKLFQIVSFSPKQIEANHNVKMILLVKGNLQNIHELLLIQGNNNIVATVFSCKELSHASDIEKYVEIVWEFCEDFLENINEDEVNLKFGEVVIGNIEVVCKISRNSELMSGYEIRDVDFISTIIKTHAYYSTPCYHYALELVIGCNCNQIISLLSPDTIPLATHLLPDLDLIDLKRLYVVSYLILHERYVERNTSPIFISFPDDYLFESLYFQLTNLGNDLYVPIQCKIIRESGDFIIETPNGDSLSNYYLSKMIPNDRISLIKRVGQTFCFLHRHNLVYTCLDFSNIINDNGIWKLAFMSLSNLGDGSEIQTVAGTMDSYIPPEMIEGIDYSQESDLYSFGMFCLHILDGCVEGDIEKRIEGVKVYENTCDIKPLQQILRGVLRYNKKERIKSEMLGNLLESVVIYDFCRKPFYKCC